MKRRLSVVAAAILVAIGGFLVAQPGGEVTGALEVAHTDDFVNPPVVHTWIRTDDGKRVKIEGHDHALPPGSRVRVHGSKIEAADGEPAIVSVGVDVLAAPRVAAAPVARNIAVLLVNFTDNTTQPFTATFINDRLFGTGQSVKAFFEEESRGAVTVTGQVFDWRTLPTTTAGCPWDSWGALARVGLDLSAFTNIVYVWPVDYDCPFAGAAYVPGRDSFNNGSPSLRIFAHELSHNFGVYHASSFNCTVNGQHVSIASPSDCVNYEYGDPYSIMGAANYYHSNVLQVGELGWLRPGEVQTVTMGSFQVYALLAPGQVKLLRVARTGTSDWFYIDIRINVGLFDQFPSYEDATKGVSVRISPGEPVPGSYYNPHLLDGTPETPAGGFQDAALPVGRTLVDPVSGISIRTDAASNGQATVTITQPGPAPTSVPSSSPAGGPTPTPTPTPLATPTPVPSPSPSPVPTPTPSPTPQPPGSVEPIGQASRSSGGNGSLAVTLTRSVPAGDTVVVAASVGTFAGPVACRDSRGNTYTVNADVAGRLFLCVSRVSTPLGSGDAITVTYPAFSGLALAQAVDAGPTGPVSGGAKASGNSAAPNLSLAGGAIGAIGYGATPTFTPKCGALVTEYAVGAGSGRKVIEVLTGATICGTLSAARPWQAVAVGF